MMNGIRAMVPDMLLQVVAALALAALTMGNAGAQMDIPGVRDQFDQFNLSLPRFDLNDGLTTRTINLMGGGAPSRPASVFAPSVRDYDPTNGTVSIVDTSRGESGGEPTPSAAATHVSAGTLAQPYASAQSLLWLERLKFAVAHEQSVYQTQLQHSVIIFWVVQGLVGIGMLMSCLQFARSMGRATPAEGESTEITISANQFKIKSALLGVTILGISMGFYFLYLKYVYPITVN